MTGGHFLRRRSLLFVEYVATSAGLSGIELFQVVRGGADPGTWAHWQVGMAYAGEMVTSEQSRH
jgi:hypothetical protein